jgi:hypothetical protein
MTCSNSFLLCEFRLSLATTGIQRRQGRSLRRVRKAYIGDLLRCSVHMLLLLQRFWRLAQFFDVHPASVLGSASVPSTLHPLDPTRLSQCNLLAPRQCASEPLSPQRSAFLAAVEHSAPAVEMWGGSPGS